MAAIRASIRYAKSLLELAVEQNILEAVRKDMQGMAATISESRELRSFLGSPVVKTDQKINALRQIFGSAVQPLTMLFVELVCKNRREQHLADMAKEFESLYREHLGIEKVTVTSAVALTEEERKRIMDLVNNPKVELEEKVDPSLIGGLVIRVGDNQIDNSVSSRLASLRREFDTNHYVADF